VVKCAYLCLGQYRLAWREVGASAWYNNQSGWVRMCCINKEEEEEDSELQPHLIHLVQERAKEATGLDLAMVAEDLVDVHHLG